MYKFLGSPLGYFFTSSLISIKEEARKTVGQTSIRDKFLTGIALYAAEGNKSDGKAGFSNADPRLIKFMMDWLLTFAKVSIEKMRGADMVS